MKGKIKHIGIIESIVGDNAKVRIIQAVACDSCSIANHCDVSHAKEKIIDVNDVSFRRYAVGDKVFLTTNTILLYEAVLLGFGLPLVILLSVLFVVLFFTSNDILAILCGLGSLAPYYLVLYLLRDKIKKDLTFKISDK